MAAAAVAGALALSAFVAAPAEAATPTVTVKGHVYSPTGKAVAGVVASVYYRTPSLGQYLVKRTKTSATGRYEVQVPRSFDDYKLKISDPGDNDRDMADGEWAPTVSTFDFSSSSVTRNAVVHHGAKVSGRIYDSAGKTVKAGLLVTATGDSPNAYTETYTRSDGAYYFKNLPAGNVSILVQSPTTNGNSRWYRTTVSSGSTDGNEASTLKLAYGQKTTGISLYFPTVSKITGRITVDGVEPYGEGNVSVVAALYDSDGKKLREYYPNPTFQIRDLPAGTYYLGFQSEETVPEFYADASTLAAATPITVRANGAVTGLVANLASR